MSGFLRSDRSPLAAPVSATIYEGRVARAHKPGDALMYTTGPEHRDVDEVQNIVGQLAGIKVYLGHPTIFPAKDSGQKVVGFVESGRLDEDAAVARIVITDSEALAAIKAGTHELSLGYQCASLTEDRYQKGIKIDHLSIVERARCGPVCSMRTDMLEPIQSEVSVKVEMSEEVLKKVVDEALATLKPTLVEVKTDCTCKNHTINHTNGDTMSEPNKDLAAEMAALTEKLEAANKALTALEIEATNARKDADAAKAKLDSALAESAQAKLDAEALVAKAKTDAQEALNSEVSARVDARVALLVEAKPFLADAELNKMTDREIMCAVIKHVDGDEIPAEKSMDYVSGVYTGALKRGAGAGASRDAARVAIKEMRSDGVQAVMTAAQREAEAKAKMQSDSEVAWTKK